MVSKFEKWRFIQEIHRDDKNPFFLVRILINRKVVFNKHLEFEKHGGKTNAFKKAVLIRDSEVKKLGIESRTSLNSPRSRNTRNSSGYTGVRLVKDNNRGYVNFSWAGTCSKMIDGKLKHISKSFSIKKYGYKKAFLLALEYRCNGTGKSVSGNQKIPSPTDMGKGLDVWMIDNNLSTKPKPPK